MQIKILAKLGLTLTIAFIGGNGLTLAQEAPLSRGEATQMVVDFFDLKIKNRQFLRDCDLDLGTCLFTFSSRTNFDDFRLAPLILYPDVYPAHPYYKAINLATKLDLVRGYYAEESSPFRPDQPITEVEALKLIMGSAGILDWKEKFELSTYEQSWLKLELSGDTWWYGRYLVSAVQNGIWQEVSKEEAESTISKAEFLKIMESSNKIVAGGQKTSLADNYGQTNKEAYSSGNFTF